MLAALATIAGILIIGIGVGLAFITGSRSGQATDESKPSDAAGSWSTEDEGFLAVATPCCSRASLWDSLDAVSPDGQRARPVLPDEVVGWLNAWPYRSREDRDGSGDTELRVAARGRLVKCRSRQAFGKVPNDDEDVLRRLRDRRECEYSTWKAWTEETSAGHLAERHTVWVDEDGNFRGRVEYKKSHEPDPTDP
jgi:hypothetical protein